ncbi:hypothetical protein, partial [Stenotrophomonas maltophilia]|uniref:hypothetical protein n=1 Tax=Stenotrophomonas maltophilia TaxID=40324 RepID=UPI001C3FFF7B
FFFGRFLAGSGRALPFMGMSLESANFFPARAGGRQVLVAWLGSRTPPTSCIPPPCILPIAAFWPSF